MIKLLRFDFLYDYILSNKNMRDDDGKLIKIHKNVQGMLSEAKKIIQSNYLLPRLTQPGSNSEILVPQTKSNNHLKLLLQ